MFFKILTKIVSYLTFFLAKKTLNTVNQLVMFLFRIDIYYKYTFLNTNFIINLTKF